jgi:hypothetical protein
MCNPENPDSDKKREGINKSLILLLMDDASAILLIL